QENDEEHRGQRVEEKDAALAPRERRDVDVEAQDVPLEKRRDVVERLLPQLGDLEVVRQRVVAVDLSQRVDVEEDGRHAGGEHHLVGELVQQGVRIGGDPQARGDAADDRLDVHAGEDDPKAVPLVLEEERVGRVAVEGGREVEEGDADVVDIAA